MKIRVHWEETDLNLPIPTGLVFNGLTAGILPKVLEDMGIRVTRQQALRLFAALRQFRRQHKDWVLVEVRSASGDEVLIKL